MEGRAHVTATKVTVERILHGLMHERGHAELVLPNGEKVPSSDVRAAVRYVVDVFVNISKVYAELARLQAGPAEKKTKT
jgi:uncharacterized protein (DUF433 family)